MIGKMWFIEVFKFYLVTALIFISLSIKIEGAKILCIYQLPLLSHHIAFRTLTEELLRRNFEVDVVTTDPSYPKGHTPPNLTEIDLHEVSYNVWRKRVNKEFRHTTAQTNIGLTLLIDVFKNQFASKEFQDVIKSDKSYDLILADAVSPTTVILTHFFKVPMIAIATGGNLPSISEYMGIPIHVFYYSNMMSDIKYNSLYDKYEAIFSSIAWSNLFAENDKVLHEDFKKIFPELPPLTELKDNVDMLMVNMYPLWEGVRPYPPNSALFKFNGRIGQEIPEEFQTYLDSSKDGVIYASFGTSVSFSTLSRDIIASILRGFSTLPYEVLLKCDTDELAVLDRPKNVKLFKLLPQPDILRHPKIKLFITQGGLHSIDEAIDAGVPLVVIPTKFDQFANAERCVDNGIGVKLDINTISEQKLIDAIKTVVEDKRFGDNIKKLRAILQDIPMKSMDRLLWAIEYTTRHRGAKHLRTPSANMSWAEFFELELLGNFFTVVILVLWIIFRLLLAVKRTVVDIFCDHDVTTKFD